MRIGYVPYTPDLQGPGDRRRFPYYAKRKGLDFEIYRHEHKYDLLVVSTNADLSYFSRGLASTRHLVFDLPDTYLKERGWLKAAAKYFTGKWSRWEWTFHRALARMCRTANAVVCSTPEQKADLEALNVRVHDILDFHGDDLSRLKQDYKIGSPPRIVWEGVGESLYGFQAVADGFKQAARQLPFELHLVTDLEFRRMNDFRSQTALRFVRKVLEGVPCFLHQWNRGLLSAIACECDLAVIPVDLKVPLAAAKPENRLLLFWRMGVPVITSDTPSYRRAQRAANLQALCTTSEDWAGQLVLHLKELDRRRENAFAGRHYTMDHCSEALTMKKWDDVFRGMIS